MHKNFGSGLIGFNSSWNKKSDWIGFRRNRIHLNFSHSLCLLDKRALNNIWQSIVTRNRWRQRTDRPRWSWRCPHHRHHSIRLPWQEQTDTLLMGAIGQMIIMADKKTNNNYTDMNVRMGRSTVYCSTPCLQLWTNSLPITHGCIQHSGNTWWTAGLNSDAAPRSISKLRKFSKYTMKL